MPRVTKPRKALPAKMFAANLRLLTERETSVVSLCQSIGINRQQFNKYLSGSHLPSRRNLTVIATHFGVSEKDLFLDGDAFSAIYAINKEPVISLLASAPQLARFIEQLPSTARAAQDKAGIYWKYHCSSIYEQCVLRSLVRISIRDGLVQYETIERFQDLDDNYKTAYRFRYQGLCFMLEDRLFLIDIEVRQNNEMTFSVLMPIVRKPQRFLFGLTTGIAATAFREPYSARVAFQQVEGATISKAHLGFCKALAFDDRSIPAEIRSYLGLGNRGKAEILRGI